jgi:hypothetical protein
MRASAPLQILLRKDEDGFADADGVENRLEPATESGVPNFQTILQAAALTKRG